MRLPFRSAPDTGLYDLFEQSGQNIERAGALLRELLADYPDRTELTEEIRACEQAGDRVTHDIIHRLNGGGASPPFPSSDAYELARALDDIVDYTEQTAVSLQLYAVEAPMAQAEELAEVLVGATEGVARALRSFRQGSELAPHLVEIHRLENEGDRVSRGAIASLFQGGIDPMVVIRWKDIFELLEQAIDACETVAHLLEGISLKNGR